MQASLDWIMNNTSESEILISEEKLQKFNWILLCLTILFTIIGVFVSPLDDQGKPVLFLPEVKALEDYRHTAQGWFSELSILDGEIANMLSAKQPGDLFLQSRAAQQTLQHAVELVQQVDRTRIPPIGIGLQEQMLSTSMSYLEAARNVLKWVSLPDDSNLEQAIQQLADSRMLKSELERNPWMNTP
jgi:hypothetical protein